MADSTTDSQPDLSITIVSFNSSAVTCDAIQSIISQTRELNYEIIVVDNGSIDDSVIAIESMFPDVQMILNGDNRGFAVAQNMAMQASSGRYILALNSDTRFLGNAAKTMITSMEAAGDDVGFLGPKVLNDDGTTAHTMRRTAIYSKFKVALSIINQHFPFGRLIPLNFIRQYFGRLFGRVHDAFDVPSERQDVEWVDGMSVLMRREALVETGLFDEQFFFGAEIGDLLYRAISAGWRIIYDPAAQVIHMGGQSRMPYTFGGFHSQVGWLRYFAKIDPSYVDMMRRMYLIMLFWADKKERVLKLLGHRSMERAKRLQFIGMTRDAMRGFTVEKALSEINVPRLS